MIIVITIMFSESVFEKHSNIQCSGFIDKCNISLTFVGCANVNLAINQHLVEQSWHSSAWSSWATQDRSKPALLWWDSGKGISTDVNLNGYGNFVFISVIQPIWFFRESHQNPLLWIWKAMNFDEFSKNLKKLWAVLIWSQRYLKMNHPGILPHQPSKTSPTP